MQTDQTASTENLQVELGELNKQLEALEQRGVEIEKNLRECKNGTCKYSRYNYLLAQTFLNITSYITVYCVTYTCLCVCFFMFPAFNFR